MICSLHKARSRVVTFVIFCALGRNVKKKLRSQAEGNWNVILQCSWEHSETCPSVPFPHPAPARTPFLLAIITPMLHVSWHFLADAECPITGLFHDYWCHLRFQIVDRLINYLFETSGKLMFLISK